ncbi:RNA degradosome polyphosphate kinase [Defluviitalea phaphyphila]|uniref:RNA degradosome polyphosphate kinase n=1 Tax=Defluviitalea phaphyphila TaxID=1473580 RepID=UPI000730C7C2|nr:RNA degradosome polyphosphate kinase [Defluviitalea phaphyphila]
MGKKKFKNPDYFINRELSWLEFNYRVLKEAKNTKNPLFEKIKFLAIVSSNLDEFFMVRVARLKDQVEVGLNKKDHSGLTPKKQLLEISKRTHKMIEEQYDFLNRAILPTLKKKGIEIIYKERLTRQQEEYIEKYFTNIIYPVLTPMVVDGSRPFPFIINKSLNIAVLLKNEESSEDKKGEYDFATIQVPSVLSRLVELPSSNKDKKCFIFLEYIIIKYLYKLFNGRKILSAHPYRITRNADFSIEEDKAKNLLIQIEKSLKQRKWGNAIRLEIDHEMDKRLINILKEALEIKDDDIYYINGPLDLTFFNKIYSQEGYEDLKYPKYNPQIPKDLLGEEDIFEVVSKKDILLHHPYESFEPIVDFIKKAAYDENVLAIKQTLYRVSENSPIIKALEEASENGKQVTVLIELKARFDEENNIKWAKRLEKAGCHVIYGLIGLKIHSKMTLVIRKEKNKIKRYVHLGTGNYNDITAKCYTDLGFITSNEYFGADATAFFNMLSGSSKLPKWYKIETSPIGLRKRFIKLIRREMDNAKRGEKAKIIAKMNSLVDSKIIMALYDASIAGVKIDLIVRGICCLKPGISGISENITVRSVVGRYLEHSRIYYFYNNGDEEVYLSSADWMPRNLDRRIEILFPIEDKNLKNRLINILENILKDNMQTSIMNSDGKYSKINRRRKQAFNSQEYFGELAIEDVKNYNKKINSLEFKIIIKA